jgi:hypothetical protein
MGKHEHRRRADMTKQELKYKRDQKAENFGRRGLQESIREFEPMGTFREQTVRNIVCPRANIQQKKAHKQAVVCERCQRKERSQNKPMRGGRWKSTG